MRFKFFFLTMAMMMVGFLMVSCSELTHKGTRPVEEIPVRIEKVGRGSDLRTTSYVGTVSSARTVMVSAKYPGTLSQLNVSQGDSVRKNQILAKVVSAAVQSSYDMAKATLDQAEDGLKRVRQVYGSGTIPEVKMVEVNTQVSKARSAERAARKALEDCTLRAPFDGVVGDVYYSVGVDLSPLEPILKILDLKDMEIEFPVPEKEIGNVRVGDSVDVIVPAMNDVVVPAVVISKGMVASSLSHSYTCKASPVALVEGLLPGMVGKVYLHHQSNPAVIIPSSVVQMDSYGKYVWLVKDNVVEKRYIRIDGFSGQGVVVTDGLEEGENLIVEGSRKVSSGMHVKMLE